MIDCGLAVGVFSENLIGKRGGQWRRFFNVFEIPEIRRSQLEHGGVNSLRLTWTKWPLRRRLQLAYGTEAADPFSLELPTEWEQWACPNGQPAVRKIRP